MRSGWPVPEFEAGRTGPTPTLSPPRSSFTFMIMLPCRLLCALSLLLQAADRLNVHLISVDDLTPLPGC